MISNHQDPSRALACILDAAHRQPSLPAGEEAGLARQALAGDAAARDRLVAGNLRRVVAVARSYRSMGVPLEDLIHEGALGLLEALRGYDPARGVRFFTYATFHVRRAMVDAIARSAKTVRVPRQVAARARRLREASPPGAPVAASRAFEVSLDQPLRGARHGGAARLTLVGPSANPIDALADQERLGCLARAVAALPVRTREVLALRHGLSDRPERTLRDVGGEIGLSKERVRQIEVGGLAALRRRLEAAGHASAS